MPSDVEDEANRRALAAGERRRAAKLRASELRNERDQVLTRIEEMKSGKVQVLREERAAEDASAERMRVNESLHKQIEALQSAIGEQSGIIWKLRGELAAAASAKAPLASSSTVSARKSASGSAAERIAEWQRDATSRARSTRRPGLPIMAVPPPYLNFATPHARAS